MKIENENSLRHYLTDKINLFTGAGFSILAQDMDNKNLPLGSELNEELKIKFKKRLNLPLPPSI